MIVTYENYIKFKFQCSYKKLYWNAKKIVMEWISESTFSCLCVCKCLCVCCVCVCVLENLRRFLTLKSSFHTCEG